MATIAITFDEAKRDFPNAVQQILNEIQASKTKAKTTSPDKYKWSIRWCTRIECSPNPFQPGYDHAAELKKDEEERKWTVQQRVDDYVKRSSFGLEAICKRSWYAELDSTPKQAIDKITAMFVEEVAEEQHVDSLTPEQREAEVADILQKLTGQPGFMAVRIPTKP
jgi:hypothetical protein